MQLAMIGLGKMGLNMTKRLIQGGHRVVGYAHTKKSVAAAVRIGATGARSLEEAVAKLSSPRVVWLMIPAGKPVHDAIARLSSLLKKGDILIDGGNSHFKEDELHAAMLKPRGIHYLDIGVSGGIWGLDIGYCMMAGGGKAAFKKVEPALKTLAPKDGYAHVGPVGAGHYVKMVHNGVEYALMQSYAEGFELMRASPYKIDLRQVAHLWNQGSVVRSWLLELAEDAFKKDPGLKNIKGFVNDSGEGRWTVLDAVENAVPASTIALALFRRFRSRQRDSFSDKVLAALRNEFGGHAVKKA
ncbi:MAG: 6-phosphogluconate dehydrogenase (decarboxylating) [Elusimicrobia bacterium CG1_02_63_36]|nr:MAG: 6-phosphogluconate dehydrogenase (decarboxylating) [Elusimicrobia bacterium CG1_02_63_36]